MTVLRALKETVSPDFVLNLTLVGFATVLAAVNWTFFFAIALILPPTFRRQWQSFLTAYLLSKSPRPLPRRVKHSQNFHRVSSNTAGNDVQRFGSNSGFRFFSASSVHSANSALSLSFLLFAAPRPFEST